jgi:ribonuclease P protein component
MSGLFRKLTLWQKKEVDIAFKSSKNLYYGPTLNIRYASSKKEYGRLLFLLPAKIGSAVKRNLFKKRFKSIFYQEKLYEKRFDWIIFVKKEGLILNFQDLKNFILKSALNLPENKI